MDGSYPRASRIGWTHARHCPFLKCHGIRPAVQIRHYNIVNETENLLKIPVADQLAICKTSRDYDL